MRIIDLALKDLQQHLREKMFVLFMLVMPIAFTAFMGFAFGQAGAAGDPRLPVGFVDNDNASVLSRGLLDLLETSGVIRPVVLQGADVDRANEKVKNEELAAVVIVPAGFGAQTVDDIRLDIIADMNATAGHTARNAIQTALVRLIGAMQVAQISVERMAAVKPFADEAAQRAAFDAAIAQASAAWQDTPIGVTVETAIAASDDAQRPAPTGNAQASPGMIVQFTILGLVSSASILVLERKTRTLQRLLTTSMRRWEIIAGHTLAMFVIVLTQEALLVAAGQLIFGVDYAREPLAVLMVMAGLAAWIAGLGLFISTLAKVEDQAAVFSLIAMFLFSALGGAWFPLEGTGPAFNTIGHLTPGAWAMDGFQNVVVRGLGIESVLLPSGVLLAYAAAFFGLAVWRFKFE